MGRHLSTQQDLLSSLVATHEIHAGNDVGEEKITIERLEVHLGQPSGVELTLGRVHALSTVRRRRPFYLLPPRPSAMINHSTELETLQQTLYNFKVADLNGPDGAGKSTLAAALVHTLDLSHFSDGVVFVTGRIQHPDLLQALFNSFYESDSPVKITSQHAPSYLYNLRALVILDDVGLGPKQIDPILDALGNTAVLIVGPERTAVGRGHALPLKGLPRQDAVALFEEMLGRTPAPDEYPIIEQICALLNDMPLPISCLAAHAAQTKGSLTRVLIDLQERKSWAGPGGDLAVGPSLEQIVLTLDGTDRQLLTLLAAFAGPSASIEALRTLMILPPTEFQKRVERLQELGLLHVVGPKSRDPSSLHLALAPAYHQAVRTWLVDEAVRLGIVEYYTTRLSRGNRLTGDELPGLLGAIEDCARNGWLDALQLLVRAADRSLAWLGWWAEWQHVLDLTRRAAQAGGDRALEAWAMHQLGSVLGALGVFERAFHLLRTALSMRQALGDEAGATLSARNLQVLDQLAPEPSEEKAPEPSAPAVSRGKAGEPSPAPQEKVPSAQPSPPSGAGKAKRLRVGLAALAVLAVLAIGAFGLWFVLGGGEDGDGVPPLTASWEFGDAWNTYDNETWTQQIIIVAEGGDGDYRYSADGKPVGEMFEVVLPLCDEAQGIIQVQSGDGQTAQVEYKFDSPFCR